MSQVVITESNLTNIANAIRSKNGSSDLYTPAQMATAIQNIPTGITPTGTVNITQNGTVDVTQYAYAAVNVSGGGGDVEPTLPAAYQEVEYMDFDGNSYVTINSDYIPETTVLETVVERISDYTGENVAIGITNPGSNARFELYIQSGKAYVWGASINYRCAIDTISAPGTSLNVYSSIALNEKKYLYLELFTFNVSRYLAIGRYGTGSQYRNRLYKIRHRVRQDTIGNTSGAYASTQYQAYAWYKPCYRKADNVPGWYDTRTDTFYVNEGTGAFTVGPDVT